jgi:uncharacterized protein (DUF1684 family)
MGLAMASSGSAYVEEIQKWRDARETRMKSDTGWLTVAGLFWLKEGDNRFDTDKANDIMLPEGTAPARAGLFRLASGVCTVVMEPGVAATLQASATPLDGGTPVTTAVLRDDTQPDPEVIVLGRLRMFVIKRGERFAIRMRDLESSMRKEFTGLHWYPIQESYRVTASFEPSDPPTEVPVPNILGETEKMPSPGVARFQLQGRSITLRPVLETPDAKQLFFIFKDTTAGRKTYGAGRFLYAELPADGKVVLDFNKAYTPPCAFTPFATCPLPPESNRLDIAIEAGELDYGHH